MASPVFSLPEGQPGGNVRSPKTAELLTRRLRRMIVNGELRDGDYLPREAELMTHFGVSRPTLREAVRVLESESLVEVRRGSRTGARVRVPGPEMVARPAGLLLAVAGTTLGEVLTARLGIEPLAAWLLADHGAPDAIEALVAALDALKSDIEQGQPTGPGFARFHQVVVEQSGNRALVITAGMLQEIIARHMSTATKASNEADPDEVQLQFRRAVRAYEKLIALIRAGETDEAERFWRRHLLSANESLLRGFDANAVIDIAD